MTKLQRYQKALAVLLVALVSFAAPFIPALRDVPPDLIAQIALGLAVVLVYVIPNKIEGFNVDKIAESILDVKKDMDAQTVALSARALAGVRVKK